MYTLIVKLDIEIIKLASLEIVCPCAKCNITRKENLLENLHIIIEMIERLYDKIYYRPNISIFIYISIEKLDIEIVFYNIYNVRERE